MHCQFGVPADGESRQSLTRHAGPGPGDLSSMVFGRVSPIGCCPSLFLLQGPRESGSLSLRFLFHGVFHVEHWRAPVVRICAKCKHDRTLLAPSILATSTRDDAAP